MKIFYIEGERNLLNMIPLQLEAEIDCKVFEADAEIKGLHWLKTNDLSELSLILCNDSLLDYKGEKIYQFVKENFSHIPFLLISDQKSFQGSNVFETFVEDNPYNIVFPKTFEIESIVAHIKKIASIQPPDALPDISSPYCRLCHSRFRLLEKCPSEIFLKLSEVKYVKIINAGESISESLIDHYLEKGIESYYIHRTDFPLFTKEYNRLLEEKITEKHSQGKDAEIHLRAFEGVQDHIHNLGIDPVAIETITHISEKTISTLRKDPKLGDLIQAIMRQQNYLSEHSLMISYVSGAIALGMEWVTDSTLQKLAAASILHDACLQDCDLAKASQLLEADWKKKLSSKDIELIKTHPYHTALLAQQSSRVDPCVDLIILSHHERMDAQGYPRHLDWTKIYPLASLFIVAEDFVHEIYGKKMTASDIRDVINSMQNYYTKGNFKKAIEALHHVFIEKGKF